MAHKIYIVQIRSDNGGQEYFIGNSVRAFDYKKHAQAYFDYMQEQHIAMFGKENGERVDMEIIETELHKTQVFYAYKCLTEKHDEKGSEHE